MNRNEMVSALQGLGFLGTSTASNKWKRAHFYSNDELTMVILVRSRGIDVLFTKLGREQMTNSDGYLTVSSQRPGDIFVEYFYTESDVDIHSTVFDAAEKFARKEVIDLGFYKGSGISRTDWGYKYGHKSRSSKIRYEETSKEDRIRYAEYKAESGKRCFEILVPQTIMGNTRLEHLAATLKEGKIADLNIKMGLCWAQYISVDGYNTHTLLTNELRDNTTDSISDFENSNGDIVRAAHDGHTLLKLNTNIEKGRIDGFDIVFGERLPMDFYGDYDYSTYPGGMDPPRLLAQTNLREGSNLDCRVSSLNLPAMAIFLSSDNINKMWNPIQLGFLPK